MTEIKRGNSHELKCIVWAQPSAVLVCVSDLPTVRIGTTTMNAEAIYRRYQELQGYVGWTDEDSQRVQSVATLLAPCLPELVDDFYAEIERHPATAKVITGGRAQVARLKGTLVVWLQELLQGRYDQEYVARRWRVGWRHVEIGLDQVYTNVALSRLRRGLLLALEQCGVPLGSDPAVRRSLNTLLDLDLALIEDAYQAEYMGRLQRSERLVAIGQVSGGIAHELRNPLNVIKTSIYYLLHAKNPTPLKTAEHLQRVERHVTVADGVITALSNFAKLPVPNLRPFPLDPCLREVLELNPIPDNIHVVVDCPDALPPVLADPDQLRIVFANLIRNAREAMPQGGKLTLAAHPANGAIDVSVTDTGMGITPENLSRIAEPLFSTKARGLGLGLAIVRSILEKNACSLHISSSPGKGSTFTVRLMAAPDSASREQLAEVA